MAREKSNLEKVADGVIENLKKPFVYNGHECCTLSTGDLNKIKDHIMFNLLREDVPKTNEYINQVIGDAPYGNNFNVVTGKGADGKPIAFTGLTKIYYDELKVWKKNVFDCTVPYISGASPAPSYLNDYSDYKPMLWVDKLDQCIKPLRTLAAQTSLAESVNSRANTLESRANMLESRRLEDEKIRQPKGNDAPPPYVEMPPPPPYSENPVYEESKSNAQKR